MEWLSHVHSKNLIYKDGFGLNHVCISTAAILTSRSVSGQTSAFISVFRFMELQNKGCTQKCNFVHLMITRGVKVSIPHPFDADL